MTQEAKVSSKHQIQKFLSKEKRKPAQTIQNFADSASSQSFESKLGNLMLANTGKAIVLSIPVIIQKSSYRPFGDGQSNAKLSLGSSWKQNDFPVVGIQETASGKSTRKYIFHSSLNVTNYQETQVGGDWYKVQPTPFTSLSRR